MMKPIGGYFELELPRYSEYHKDAVALNSGRFCLEYLLRCRMYRKVYVPYFTCDTAIEPMQKLGVLCEFYRMDENMHLVDKLVLEPDEALLYTNYWGLQTSYCEQLAAFYGQQLILDYTQAFYTYPIQGIDTFYSCRKFFGVPDGGYLYTDAQPDFELYTDESYTRMDSLVKRIDLSPEAGYADFHRISASFHQIPIRRMSKLTQRMMRGISYDQIAKVRRSNYSYLKSHLGGSELSVGEVPMIFPFVHPKGQELRRFLIENKVFVAKYWPNVDEWAGPDALETWWANHVLPLPIDQRYGDEDMKRICKLILEDYEKENLFKGIGT